MRLLETRAAFLLLLSVSNWSRGEALVQVKALTGSDVTFKANVSAQPSEISWVKDNRKIVEVEEGRPEHFFTWEERVNVDLRQRTFLLKKVSPADSGHYEAVALVEGRFEYTDIELQVYDHVCNVTIHNITVENNVTLQCACSSSGAPPSECKWYECNGGTCKFLTTFFSIIVLKGTKPQEYKLVARNEVSNTSAYLEVPSKNHEPKSRLYIFALLAIGIIIIIIIIAAILLRKKTNKAQDSEENKRLIGGKPRFTQQQTEPLTTCVCIALPLLKENDSEIVFKKAETFLMKLVLHLQSIHLVNRKGRETELNLVIYKPTNESDAAPGFDMLLFPENVRDAEKITWMKDDTTLVECAKTKDSQHLTQNKVSLDPASGCLTLKNVEENDKGQYIMVTNGDETTTQKFSLTISTGTKSTAKVEAGTHDDQSARGADLVNPTDGELNVQIRNAKNAETITWKKDGSDILSVACSPHPLLDRPELSKGALGIGLMSGDKGPYCADVSLSDGNSVHYDVNVNRKGRETELNLVIYKPTNESDAAPGFDMILFPEDVRDAEKITWMKDNTTLVECAKTKDSQHLTQNKVSLDPSSGCLTLKNVEENDKGQYIMVTNGDETTTQKFSLTISIETSF